VPAKYTSPETSPSVNARRARTGPPPAAPAYTATINGANATQANAG
jgi:hypothetical protein